VAGLVVSVLWLAGVGVWAFMVAGPAAPADRALQTMIVLIAAILPVMLLWGALAALRLGRILRGETARLRAAIEAERAARVGEERRRAPMADPAVHDSLADLLAAQHRIEAALAASPAQPPVPDPASDPAPDPAPPAPEPAPAPPETAPDQEVLPFEPTGEETPPPLAWADFIRALNFPDNPDDIAGFDALRRALRDRPTAQLVRAAQDVLTLLAQDGLYMDDLPPDTVHPETWRRFATGERGRAIAALGGIHDSAALERVGARMKRDPIFRDAAHHFLRRFDRIVSQFAELAPDADLCALSDTRTARAFMLLGRSAGTFD